MKNENKDILVKFTKIDGNLWKLWKWRDSLQFHENCWNEWNYENDGILFNFMKIAEIHEIYENEEIVTNFIKIVEIYENYENGEIRFNSVTIVKIYEIYKNGEILFDFMKIVKMYENNENATILNLLNDIALNCKIRLEFDRTDQLRFEGIIIKLALNCKIHTMKASKTY